MAQTFTVAGALSLPLEDGTSVGAVSLAASFNFSSRADFSRTYTGVSVDDVVNFGTLTSPGAKGLIVKCTAGSCTVKFNGGSDAWPLAPGGYFLWVNSAQAFPTAALVTTTGAATVIFIAVG